jgi:hypothetical protein
MTAISRRKPVSWASLPDLFCIGTPLHREREGRAFRVNRSSLRSVSPFSTGPINPEKLEESRESAHSAPWPHRDRPGLLNMKMTFNFF